MRRSGNRAQHITAILEWKMIAIRKFNGAVATAPLRSQGRETKMVKGEQKGNKEARKPKKAAPPKQNASNPSMKGTDKSKPG